MLYTTTGSKKAILNSYLCLRRPKTAPGCPPACWGVSHSEESRPVGTTRNLSPHMPHLSRCGANNSLPLDGGYVRGGEHTRRLFCHLEESQPIGTTRNLSPRLLPFILSDDMKRRRPWLAANGAAPSRGAQTPRKGVYTIQADPRKGRLHCLGGTQPWTIIGETHIESTVCSCGWRDEVGAGRRKPAVKGGSYGRITHFVATCSERGVCTVWRKIKAGAGYS